VITTAAKQVTENHHASHRHLLDSKAVPQPAKVDAIIVPTARPVVYLKKSALGLAKYHGCPLVVLCSHRANARDAAEAGAKAGVKILAIDLDAVPTDELVPTFAANTVLRGSKFDRRTDTSLKRNLGLMVAQAFGWERIVFLDDDISVPQPDDLKDAVGLLDKYSGVGLAIGGMLDNSVVCHAFRDAGGQQDTFIGGGAMAVGAESFTSFFPNMYNEDWFFLLDDTGLRPSAVTGSAIQTPFDPYRETMRARSEELGDCLAEGLFGLLDNGDPLSSATATYWWHFLNRRRRFIDEVIGMVQDAELDPADRIRMIAALKAANGRNKLIKPKLCVDYLAAWQVDRERWRRHMKKDGPELMGKLLADRGLNHLLHPAVV
jgi:hypothetical protein